ncbi:LacI family DNA-binding transcriptional regulator [Arthrobacter sp. KNU40]|uniref:LacI family DNA-binding transcriptional regulator n=1 Tax=Arthrobacter sp. KNU40 TaxID=3447965 RepID=UPI003F5DA01F
MTVKPESSERKAATIYDVAALARVSHQSVSRLLKGEKVSEDTRVRVEAALEELNYRPNIAARSLATRRTNRIGALMYDMSQMGPLQLMTGAGAAARKAGYVLDIVSLDPSDDRSIQEAIRLVNQQDIAGILAFAPTNSMLRMLREATFRVPIYLEPESENDVTERPDVGIIAADQAIQHLLTQGHRQIVHISGPLDWPSARSRAAAYSRGIREAGGKPFDYFEGDWSAASGYERTREILASVPGVTAIFAANDQMALGALHALAELGIPVPEAVSVVGMDDAPDSRFYNPSLSTVPLNFQAQGQYAFEGLLARIEGRERTLPPDYIRTSFLQRGSSGPAPGRR